MRRRHFFGKSVDFSSNLSVFLKMIDNFTDETGNTSVSSVVNVTYEATSIDKASVFNGNAYGELADADVLSFTDGVNDLPATFIIPVYFFSLSGIQFIICKRGNFSQIEWQINIEGGGLAFKLINNNNTDQIKAFLSTSELDVNAWNHLGFVYNGSKSESGIKIFKNGVLKSTTNSQIGTYSGQINGTNVCRIGYNSWNPLATDPHKLNAKIESVYIYKNREFTNNEMNAAYQKWLNNETLQ